MNLDPQRIGVMGFSAGGHLSAMASNNFDKRTYPAVDAADKASCRRISVSWFILPIWMVKISSWLRRSKYLLPLPYNDDSSRRR